MRVATGIALIALTAIVGCDDAPPDEGCITSIGTYNCTWREGTGDCTAEIIDAVMGLPCGIRISADEECGPFEFENVTDDGAGCRIIETYIGTGGDDLILHARAEVSVDCPEVVCYQEFEMDF